MRRIVPDPYMTPDDAACEIGELRDELEDANETITGLQSQIVNAHRAQDRMRSALGRVITDLQQYGTAHPILLRAVTDARMALEADNTDEVEEV